MACAAIICININTYCVKYVMHNINLFTSFNAVNTLFKCMLNIYIYI